ncbi:hypothetical protein ABPG74_004954 [Tetrahymena malaccensis]
MGFQFKAEYIILVICAIWIVIDAMIAHTLFEANHHVAKYLQGGVQNISSPRYMVFRIITQFGYAQIVGIFIAGGFFLFPNKIQALKVLIYTLFCSYILSLLKLIYHEPRPYFVYPDLQGIGCDTEFGKPSGHAMVTSVMYFILIDSFLNRKFFDFTNSINFVSGKRDSGHVELVEVVIIDKQNPQNDVILNQQAQEDKFLGNSLAFVLYLIWIFLIGFSRVILGAHSFSQVLLGWTYGIICIILYRLVLEKQLENVLLTAAHKGFASMGHFYKYALGSLFLYAVLITINIVIYNIVNKAIKPEDRERYANNIKQKTYCVSKFNPDHFSFLADKCMMDSVTLAVCFGVIITTVFTKGSYKPEKWNENFKNVSISKKIARILVTAIVCAIPVGMTFFLKFNNIYYHYFFKAALQAFLVSFCLIKVAPWAIKKVNMDIEGDFLQFGENSSFFDSSFTEKDFIQSYYK